MNSDPWKGSNVPEYPKVLILGESHYDEENYGEKVSFPTSGVVKRYFESRHKWSQFFDKMAASFGYEKDNARAFFEKVYFGNYIDVVCGIGDNSAKKYAELNRDRYNDEWFEFINQNSIDVVVCFSKLVYDHFPSLSEASDFEREFKDYVGDVGSKGNYVRHCTYSARTEHNHCSVKLLKPLSVYGIRHPSARGGYNSAQIYEFVSKQDNLEGICFHKGVSTVVKVPESLLVKADTLCKMFLKERSDVISTQGLTNSFYQYVRAFCLMIATRCKNCSDVDYRDLVNHITAPALGQILEEDYEIAIEDSKIGIYENYLTSNHRIIQTLRAYDQEYSAASSEAFLRLLLMLALVFVEIDTKNQTVANTEIAQFIKNMRSDLLATEVEMSPVEASKEVKVQQSEPLSSQEHKKSYPKTREVDFQCFVRVVLPLMAIMSCCLYAFRDGLYFLLGVAIIPFIISIPGINAYKKRCPNCRAWASLYIADQELVKQDKVKVRRPLGSAYIRSSGRVTFGVRQAFVSADEKTYNVTVKCRICDYETKSLRSVIDDKIR